MMDCDEEPKRIMVGFHHSSDPNTTVRSKDPEEETILPSTTDPPNKNKKKNNNNPKQRPPQRRQGRNKQKEEPQPCFPFLVGFQKLFPPPPRRSSTFSLADDGAATDGEASDSESSGREGSHDEDQDDDSNHNSTAGCHRLSHHQSSRGLVADEEKTTTILQTTPHDQNKQEQQLPLSTPPSSPKEEHDDDSSRKSSSPRIADPPESSANAAAAATTTTTIIANPDKNKNRHATTRCCLEPEEETNDEKRLGDRRPDPPEAGPSSSSWMVLSPMEYRRPTGGNTITTATSPAPPHCRHDCTVEDSNDAPMNVIPNDKDDDKDMNRTLSPRRLPSPQSLLPHFTTMLSEEEDDDHVHRHLELRRPSRNRRRQQQQPYGWLEKSQERRYPNLVSSSSASSYDETDDQYPEEDDQYPEEERWDPILVYRRSPPQRRRTSRRRQPRPLYQERRRATKQECRRTRSRRNENTDDETDKNLDRTTSSVGTVIATPSTGETTSTAFTSTTTAAMLLERIEQRLSQQENERTKILEELQQIRQGVLLQQEPQELLPPSFQDKTVAKQPTEDDDGDHHVSLEGCDYSHKDGDDDSEEPNDLVGDKYNVDNADDNEEEEENDHADDQSSSPVPPMQQLLERLLLSSQWQVSMLQKVFQQQQQQTEHGTLSVQAQEQQKLELVPQQPPTCLEQTLQEMIPHPQPMVGGENLSLLGRHHAPNQQTSSPDEPNELDDDEERDEQALQSLQQQQQEALRLYHERKLLELQERKRLEMDMMRQVMADRVQEYEQTLQHKNAQIQRLAQGLLFLREQQQQTEQQQYTGPVHDVEEKDEGEAKKQQQPKISAWMEQQKIANQAMDDDEEEEDHDAEDECESVFLLNDQAEKDECRVPGEQKPGDDRKKYHRHPSLVANDNQETTIRHQESSTRTNMAVPISKEMTSSNNNADDSAESHVRSLRSEEINVSVSTMAPKEQLGRELPPRRASSLSKLLASQQHKSTLWKQSPSSASVVSTATTTSTNTTMTTPLLSSLSFEERTKRRNQIRERQRNAEFFMRAQVEQLRKQHGHSSYSSLDAMMMQMNN